MKLRRLAFALVSLLALGGNAVSQWQVPDHRVPIGRGQGFSGFKSATPGVSGQVLQSTGVSTDPVFTDPTIWTPEEFGALCNTVRVNSSSVTVGAGSTALTVVGANFVAGDVGKVITIQSAGIAGVYHTTTIAARVSATQVTLGAAAVTAVAGVAKEVIYGTDDTAAFAAAATAMRAGTVKSFQHKAGCKYLVFPSPTPSQILLDLTGVTGLTYYGAASEIVVAYSSNATNASMFSLTSTTDTRITGLLGYAIHGLGPGGATGFNWVLGSNSTGTGCHRIFVQGSVTGGRSFVDFNRNTGAFSTNIVVSGKTFDVYYPMANESAINGNYVTLDTENAGRSLITYGNTGPTEFHITSKNPTANDIFIAAYGHSTNTALTRTSNIQGVYINTQGTTTYGNLHISHQQADPAVDSIQTIIENVDIEVDLVYPAGGSNSQVFGNDSYIGHAGTATLGDASGHIERNIRYSGTVRGKTLNSPWAAIGTAANGWTAGTGKVQWTFENLKIVDQIIHPILIGRGATVNMINVSAPNFTAPTYDAAVATWRHHWIGVEFTGTGVFNRVASFELGENNASALSIVPNASQILMGGMNSHELVFTSDGGIQRWKIENGVNGAILPITDNSTNLGNGTRRLANMYYILGQIGGSTSGVITTQPQAVAGTYNWNWPTTAGTSGQVLKSGGGGATAMSWGNAIVSITTQTFCASGCTTTIAGGSSGTYTPNANLVYAKLSCLGGGAGGGAVTGSLGFTASAGGGGAGGWSEKTVTAATIGASKAVLIGTGGAGGAAGNNAGAVGGPSCFTSSTCASGQIVTGLGGGAGNFSNSGSAGLGGIGAAAGTGDVTGTGAPGTGAFYYASSTILIMNGSSGAGGNSRLGGGGLPPLANGSANAGNNATGYGAGGSGAAFQNIAANAAGGAGSAGFCMATEYNSQ